MSYFGALRDFVHARDLHAQRGLNGAWDDDAVPAAIAWFSADFSQRYKAFDLAEGRKVMQEIIGMFFVGATFFRTTGLYQRSLSGGMSAMVFAPFFDPGKAENQLLAFKDRVRACAKELALFFAQDSVAAVVQDPDGHIKLDFVGASAPINPDLFLTPRDRTRIRYLRNKLRSQYRLPGTVAEADV